MNQSLNHNEIYQIISKIERELIQTNREYIRVRQGIKKSHRNKGSSDDYLRQQSAELKRTIANLNRSLDLWKTRLLQTKNTKSVSSKPKIKKSHSEMNKILSDIHSTPNTHSKDSARTKLLSPAYYSSNSPSSKFHVGDVIHHNKYGTGTVLSKSSSSITVLFQNHLQKELPDPDFLINIGIITMKGQQSSVSTMQTSLASAYTLSKNRHLNESEHSSRSTDIQYHSFYDTLYVYTGRIKCIRDKHNMVCVNALIDTASREVATLNVNCCLNCNRFYISYDEYTHYMEKYKSLLTRIVLVNQNGECEFNNKPAIESTLKLCGYSVSQEKSLSFEERTFLLSSLIHNGIVTKPDVIQHLNWLIRMNGKKAGNGIAKKKWEEDLAFVRELGINTQTSYKISSVVPYTK